MNTRRILHLTGISFLLFVTFCMAEASDLSTQQSAVTYARESMDKTKGDYEAKSQTLAAQQQRVATLKKQLEVESNQLEKTKKEADLARQEYTKAKQNFDKQQLQLDEAWRKGRS